jgi:hypothetical protein
MENNMRAARRNAGAAPLFCDAEIDAFGAVVKMKLARPDRKGRMVYSVEEYPTALLEAAPALLEIVKRYVESVGTHDECPAEDKCLQCAAVAAVARADRR